MFVGHRRTHTLCPSADPARSAGAAIDGSGSVPGPAETPPFSAGAGGSGREGAGKGSGREDSGDRAGAGVAPSLPPPRPGPTADGATNPAVFVRQGRLQSRCGPPSRALPAVRNALRAGRSCASTRPASPSAGMRLVRQWLSPSLPPQRAMESCREGILARGYGTLCSEAARKTNSSSRQQCDLFHRCFPVHRLSQAQPSLLSLATAFPALCYKGCSALLQLRAAPVVPQRTAA